MFKYFQMKKVFHIVERSDKTIKTYSNLKLCYENYLHLVENAGADKISYSTFRRKIIKPYVFLNYYATWSYLEKSSIS